MKSSTILVFVIFISFCFASIQSSTFDRNKGLNPKSAPQHIVADTYAQAVEQVSQLLLKSQSTPKVSQRLSLFAARIPGLKHLDMRFFFFFFFFLKTLLFQFNHSTSFEIVMLNS